jgi:hypothetical protein
MPATAPALRAALPDLTAPPMAPAAARIAALVPWPWSRGPGHVEHEKNTFFSSLQNSRSGAVSQGRPKGAAPAVGAKRRAFTDGAAEATARERAGTPVPAPMLCFHHVDAAATSGYRAVTANSPIFLLAADFTRVDARKHVNACVGAASGCRALIPLAFPQSYRMVTPQQPAGGDVSPTSHAQAWRSEGRRIRAGRTGRKRLLA